MRTLGMRNGFLCGAVGTLLLATAGGARAGEPGHYSAAEQELIKAEDALFNADVTRDVAVIRRGFTDEAIFVHANGMVQTKADYIKATESAAAGAKSVTTENRIVNVFGNVGVIRATKNIVTGNDMHLSGSYLAVYVKRDGRWQMLDSQSAPAPRGPQGSGPGGPGNGPDSNPGGK
jgi:Domain of unknown function (DUF4440)